MKNSTTEEQREFVLEITKSKALILGKEAELMAFGPKGREVSWFFDFRIPFSHKAYLETIAQLFWKIPEFNEMKSVQIAGMESASLPLITSCVLNGENATGFYIRKSRKKKSQLKQIEGDVDSNIPIVLVDDLINSGSSFKKQIAVLKKAGLRVHAIFTIVRFHDAEFYEFLKEEEISLYSLFSITDFNLNLDRPKRIKLKEIWYQSSPNPHFFPQGPKNIPVVCEDNNIIVTADNGHVRKIDTTSGEILWDRRVLLRVKPHIRTFTGSTIVNGVFYTTTTTGTLLALTEENGRPVIKINVAERFTSSLHNFGTLLCAGVHFGANRYGLYLADTDNIHDEKHIELPAPITRPPCFSTESNHLLCVLQDGHIYALTTSGQTIWKKQPNNKAPAGIQLLPSGDLLVTYGDGQASIFNARTGKEKSTVVLPQFHYDTPKVNDDLLYGATLDREIYCFDLEANRTVWSHETTGRLYSQPIVQNGLVYVGDNNGNIHVLDKKTGERVALHVVSERVTNPLVIIRNQLIVTTDADEIYALSLPSSDAE